MKQLLILFISLLVITDMYSQSVIQLPQPTKTGGMPLMEALSNRSTSRSFNLKDLPIEKISDLLWAAFGINRPDGKRTAPSSMNYQEITIYVLMKNGVYTYNAEKNELDQVLSEDIRVLGGKQDFVKDAPLTLIYVADFSKMGNHSEQEKLVSSSCNAGFIAQNVYLYCASEHLATGVRASIDTSALASRFLLPSDKKIILGQSVGYSK